MDQAQILETLKSNFLFNFRTGNVMVDTVVTGLIIMMSTYLLNLSQQLFTIDWSGWMTKRWKREARIVISGRKLQGSHNTQGNKEYLPTIISKDNAASRLHQNTRRHPAAIER